MLPPTLQPPNHGIGGRQSTKTAIKEEAINAWAELMTLSAVILNAKSNGIISIDEVGKYLLTMVRLRRFCVKFQNFWIQEQETRGDNLTHSSSSAKRSYTRESAIPRGGLQHFTRTSKQCPTSTGGQCVRWTTSRQLFLKQQCSFCWSCSCPWRWLAPSGLTGSNFVTENSAMSWAAELQASKAKKRSKSSPPLSIMQEGSYYWPSNQCLLWWIASCWCLQAWGTAINARPGHLPIPEQGCVWQITYNLFGHVDCCWSHSPHCISWQPISTGNGGVSGNVPFAAEFDDLTSAELKDVMESINHWYRHAHRQSKKSRN